MANNDPLFRAFLSYSHSDDEFLEGGISWLREELERAMHVVTGKAFEIFQDTSHISLGENWLSQIENAIDRAHFLIPILSPSYFASVNLEMRSFKPSSIASSGAII